MKKQTEATVELNTEATVATVQVNPLEAAEAAKASAAEAFAAAKAAFEAAQKQAVEAELAVQAELANVKAREVAELAEALAKAEAEGAPAIVLRAMREALEAAKRPAPVMAPSRAVAGRSGAAIPAYGPNAVFRIGANASRIQNRHTAQLGHNQGSGHGAEWVLAATEAPNSRWVVIQALAALGETFTHTQARQCLANLGQSVLSSGSPASYIRAFVKQGYLEVVTA